MLGNFETVKFQASDVSSLGFVRRLLYVPTKDAVS